MEEVIIEATSASLAGIVSSSALFPLEVIKTKMQAMTTTTLTEHSTKGETSEEDGTNQNISIQTTSQDESESQSSTPPFPSSNSSNSSNSSPTSPTMITVGTEIYKANGVMGFYKGMMYSAVQSAMEKGLYFVSYTALKSIYRGITLTQTIGTLPNLCLGCAAEWCHLPFTMPLDCLTTALATDTRNRAAYAVMSSLLSSKGCAGMYAGVEAFAVLCFKPAIQYTVYEKVKSFILLGRGSKSKTLSAAEAFLLGMVARTVATIAVFPYTRAKVMLQSGSRAPPGGPASGIPGLLRAVYEDEGMAGVFRGIGPELTRGVLSAALMLMVKEKIRGRVETAVRGSHVV
mmetsp:Transcript_7172/g.14921  ORF Transcript_7172/g.14921 Transcript_7172/m.14921 type:complete len:345 (-) Transcript_7172:37-1071(-)